MRGIHRSLTLETKHINKHLPNTPEMQRLLRQEGCVHIFKDENTLKEVAQSIITEGEFTGMIRGSERYGLFFAEPIGYRLTIDGNRQPLYYGEIKITGDRYHVIPRTRPSK